MSHRNFVAHFGISKYPAQARNPLFPIPIGHLAEIIPPETATKDELLRNQTLLPFLKPFVLPKYYEKVLNRTEFGTSRVDLAKRVSSPELQFCARCAEEDQKKHGTPYLRRFHQLPGTTVCVAHLLRLTPIPRPYETGYHFFDLRKLLEIPTKSSPKVSDRAITLAQDLHAIPQIFDSMEPIDVWGAIRWELGKIGKRTDNLPGLMKAQTGEAFLRFVGPLAKNLGLSGADIRTLKHLRRQQRSSTPALALLYIRFCGHTLESFVDAYNRSVISRPTNRPCRNPHCAAYKQLIIPDTRDSLEGTEYYIFKCPRCEFTYLLTRLNLVHEGSHLVVYSLGDKQNARFAQQWANPNASFDSIRKQFGLTHSAVFHLARFRGLAMDRNGLSISKHEYRNVCAHISKRAKKIETAKKILLKGVSRYPGYTFSRLLREADARTRSAAAHLRMQVPEWVRANFKARMGRPPRTPSKTGDMV